MGERNLYVGSLKMYDGIQALGTHALHEQILKTVARHKTLAVIPVSLAPLIEETVLSSLCILTSFVIDQVAIGA